MAGREDGVGKGATGCTVIYRVAVETIRNPHLVGKMRVS